MTIEIAPDNEQRRSERRRDWHTPEDCFKLLDVQAAMDRIFDSMKKGDDRMDSIFGHLEAGDIRMGCIEDNIAGNHRVVTDDIKDLKAELKENTAKTDEIFEIVQMGKGFFKGLAWTGKWLRRIVMWVVPPVAAVVGLWQTLRPPK